MRPIQRLASLVIMLLWPTLAVGDDPRAAAAAGDTVLLRASRLECLVGNNKSLLTDRGQHRGGYNGVFWMQSPDQPASPFVTAYAGWNLEHYFDARGDYEGVLFEPRQSTLNVRTLADGSVELHQPTTATFGVESWTTFQIHEPYYLDFSFRCALRRDNLQGNFLGVFWASYMNGPLDKSIYFLDANATLDQPLWRQLCTQAHNRDSSVRHRDDRTEQAFQNPGAHLFSSFSPFRYSQPFFYGRFRNMVLIYVFQPNPHLRFTHSPSGGGQSQQGDDTNPAWDFHLAIPNPTVNEKYRLNGRMIYKPWSNRADVLREVATYLEPR